MSACRPQPDPRQGCRGSQGRGGCLVKALAAVLAAAGAVGACGKKGPPLPPLLRLPAAVTDLRAQRVDDRVYLRFTVPAANVEGDTPADLARVEVYGLTARRAPVPADAPRGDLRRLFALVASAEVQPPAPPGAQPPEPTRAAVLAQGAGAVLWERLTPEAEHPVALDAAASRREGAMTMPDTATDAAAARPRRYYFVVGINRRGRAGPPSALVDAPVGAVPGPPTALSVHYTDTALTLEWAPPEGPGAEAGAEGAPPVRYQVYLAGPGTTAIEAPLNAEPLAEPRYVEPRVTFGEERCFVVRAVGTIDGFEALGPASPPACVTPRDTFPPSAPANLAAVASAGAISLIWDPAPEADVAGYLVLRGIVDEAGGPERLEAITPRPIRERTFRDTTVAPGVRYVYAVLAVDAASNASALSNRVVETARD